MKISIFLCTLTLCLLLPERLLAGTEPISSAVTRSATDIPAEGDGLSYEFEAEETYIGGGDLERGFRRFDDVEENNALLRFVFTPRIKFGILRLGAGFERYDFDVPSFAEIPDSLQAMNLIVGLDTQLSDSILIRAQIQPGLYNSGLGHLFWDDFNMPFVIGGTYIFSPNLQLILGLSIDVERKYPVIPAAGVRWKIGPQWLLDAVLPTPRLQYEMTRDLSLYAGATITDATFRTDDEFGDSHGIPRLNHAVVTYSEIRTGAGFDWKISPIVTFTGEVGYQPYRNFDFYRADVRYHQDGGAPYGTISLHGAF